MKPALRSFEKLIVGTGVLVRLCERDALGRSNASLGAHNLLSLGPSQCAVQRVRQEYTFSPPQAVRDMEDYTIQLQGVTTLQLQITRNTSGGTMRASLAQWTVA